MTIDLLITIGIPVLEMVMRKRFFFLPRIQPDRVLSASQNTLLLGIGSTSMRTTGVRQPLTTPLSLTFSLPRGRSSSQLSQLATGVSFHQFSLPLALIEDSYAQLLPFAPSLGGEDNSEISTPILLTTTTGV